MARFLSRTFHRSFFRPAKAPSFAFNFRNCSSKPQLIEIDLASCSSSTASEADGDGVLSTMEDVIHRAMLRNSTPDWLPFLPGSSFWVPPVKRSLNATDLDNKLVDLLTEEEFLAILNSRGWPSAAHLISDGFKEAKLEMKVTVGGRELTIQMQKEDDGQEEIEFVEDSDEDLE